MPFEVSKSSHGMNCIQIKNPTARQREILRSTVANSWMDSEAYTVRVAAGAFLQCNYDDYVLVEFWKDDFQPFVDYVNRLLGDEA